MTTPDTGRKPSAPRWHLLYFVLAGFDLLTVGLSLSLSHHLMNNYEASVQTNSEWAVRLRGITELASLAQVVNAPGNDIFDSRDVTAERSRRDVAIGRFDAGFGAVVADLERNVALGQREATLAALAQTRAAMTQMIGEAERIFEHFEQGHPAAAGRRMATMDRKYGDLTNAISTAINAVQDQQSAVLQTQVNRARELRAFETVIGVLIVLMVLGVTFYGHKIGQLWRRSQEMESQKHAAEESNKAKSGFLATMSHELRTPLNAIIGYSEMLREDVDETKDAQMASDIDRIHSAGKHLLGLINEVLDWSKVEAGKIVLHPEAFNPMVLTDEIVAMIKPTVDKTGSTIRRTGEQGLTLACNDAMRIRQCLLNLASNACKFTRNGVIEIELGRGELAGIEQIVFRVRDTGLGMSAEQLARVFEPYAQADATIARDHGGTGLGLSISRELAHTMRGELSAESELGKGSCFTLSVAANLPTHASVAAGADALGVKSQHARAA